MQGRVENVNKYIPLRRILFDGPVYWMIIFPGYQGMATRKGIAIMGKVTFIVKNLTPEMLNQIDDLSDRAAYDKLAKWAFGDLRHCVTVKYGTGQFRERVEFNSFYKSEKPFISRKREPRKGYWLITFTY